jgi:hypothetical protein
MKKIFTLKICLKLEKEMAQLTKIHRANVESKLFNKLYDGCNPIERPKYGVFNIFNNPRGVGLCHGYG